MPLIAVLITAARMTPLTESIMGNITNFVPNKSTKSDKQHRVGMGSHKQRSQNLRSRKGHNKIAHCQVLMRYDKLSERKVQKKHKTDLQANCCPGGHSITKHTGEGLAQRSESKTPKYLSKNSNI